VLPKPTNTDAKTLGLLLALCIGISVAASGCAQSETNRAAQSVVATTANARIANAALLVYRIRIENEALAWATQAA
jgi:hypothetical protein